jgi:putative dimethyl sulfoxide reductase chaperone
MTLETAIKYSQVYRFLADAFLYPQENWVEDLPFANKILEEMGISGIDFPGKNLDLSSMQDLHRQTFGLTGSLCYETEYGLPHEFRQSQELADIAGFYRAFGIRAGGVLRERPDHLAVELEFMHLLCLKEAKALSCALSQEARVCRDAQGSFLKDHLGAWIGLFSQALEVTFSNPHPDMEIINPYRVLGKTANQFVLSHLSSLGIDPVIRSLRNVQPTPLGPEMSCGDCPLGERNGIEETCR